MISELKVEMEFLLDRGGADPRDDPEMRYFIFDRKGIKTDLFAIEKYVDEVLEAVLRDKNTFNTNINTPISRMGLEILNQL